MKWLLALLTCCASVFALNASAMTFTYTGPANGDFFDEANWTDPNGNNPVGDPNEPGSPLLDSTTNSIGIDLIIDGSSVVANGQVDFGSGSLTLIGGGQLEVTGSGNDIDFNSASTFTMSNSTLIVNGDVSMEGTVDLVGGSVQSITDDIEFRSTLNFTLDGTSLSSGDNTFFSAFTGPLANADIFSADRLGLDQSTAVLVTDTNINVNNGLGDVDDVFAAAGAGSSLTLAGTSTLLADTVEEGVDLILDDASSANLGGGGVEVLDNGSTATLLTTQATLQINAITNDPRASIINGLSGQSYADDPSGWNVKNWNGLDAVTLQVVGVPEPATAALLCLGLGATAMARRRITCVS